MEMQAKLSASAAILGALTVQRLYYQRDTQRNIISFLTKPYFLQGNTDPEYLVGEISKSNILSHNTPLLAGYPSANISKQKVRRMRFSGLLRPRMANERNWFLSVWPPKVRNQSLVAHLLLIPIIYEHLISIGILVLLELPARRIDIAIGGTDNHSNGQSELYQ